jgi:hypothetical protein
MINDKLCSICSSLGKFRENETIHGITIQTCFIQAKESERIPRQSSDKRGLPAPKTFTGTLRIRYVHNLS